MLRKYLMHLTGAFSVMVTGWARMPTTGFGRGVTGGQRNPTGGRGGFERARPHRRIGAKACGEYPCGYA